METERILLREADEHDAAFIVALLNDAAFLANIGDRGVRTEADAQGYIARMRENAEKHGFAMWVVVSKAEAVPVGLCGLVRRPALERVDLGFAFLPPWRARGFGREAAELVLQRASALGLAELAAICSQHNTPSRRLLERLGFRFVRLIVLPGATEEICLYERP
ncbi:MAG: GNAT family N-acetyltransferase [Myxococcota bacterium]